MVFQTLLTGQKFYWPVIQLPDASPLLGGCLWCSVSDLQADPKAINLDLTNYYLTSSLEILLRPETINYHHQRPLVLKGKQPSEWP